jgi:hypothetical protein
MPSTHLACLCRRIRSTLDARCAIAAAQFISDDEEAAHLRLRVHGFAFRAGMSAVGASDELPALFKGAPELEEAWADGFDFQTRTDEMAACEECQTGDVCPWHG